MLLVYLESLVKNIGLNNLLAGNEYFNIIYIKKLSECYILFKFFDTKQS